jgi:hypothetical protein
MKLKANGHLDIHDYQIKVIDIKTESRLFGPAQVTLEMDGKKYTCRKGDNINIEFNIELKEI